MPAAMPCKTPANCSGETCRSIGKRKIKYACIVDVDESMRITLESVPHRNHEDHISAKGINSLGHHNLVHKFIPMPQALKTTSCEGCTGKRKGKIGKDTGMAADESQKQEKEVIDEARNEGRIVHFASLMDICHLLNSELELLYQKYKGRVLFRGDIEKDDSGSYAVFTEQGSSASHLTAAKIMDRYQDYWDAQDKQQTQYPLTPRSKWKMHQRYEKFQSQNVQIFAYVYQSTNGPNHGPIWKTWLFLHEQKSTVTFWQDYYVKGNSRKFYWNTFGDQKTILICVSFLDHVFLGCSKSVYNK